jgi:hypothetical protein
MRNAESLCSDRHGRGQAHQAMLSPAFAVILWSSCVRIPGTQDQRKQHLMHGLSREEGHPGGSSTGEWELAPRTQSRLNRS